MSDSELPAALKEAWDYLTEVVSDYSRYVSEIGELGLAAPNVLYYRDEVQEMLDTFRYEPRVDFRGVWLRVRAMDETVRRRAADIVREVGRANFKQYRIINDPPKAYWWWYLDRQVQATPEPGGMWQLWRQLQSKPPKDTPQSPPG